MLQQNLERVAPLSAVLQPEQRHRSDDGLRLIHSLEKQINPNTVRVSTAEQMLAAHPVKILNYPDTVQLAPENALIAQRGV
jgi:hypothetical protein